LLEGDIAEDIIAKTREQPFPGTLSLADMAKYEPRKAEALCTPYRAHTICGAQPPASGGIAVQSILGTLEKSRAGLIKPDGIIENVRAGDPVTISSPIFRL